MNPFAHRTASLSGPATDVRPVTPDDTTDLEDVAIALYVETGGSVAIITARGQQRQVSVPDFTILPVGVSRVLATGTTATGIHAMVIS